MNNNFLDVLNSNSVSVIASNSAGLQLLAGGGSGGGLTIDQAAKLAAIPSNPLLTTDIRLEHLDADISSISGGSGSLSTI